jgi:hypothetical protein
VEKLEKNEGRKGDIPTVLHAECKGLWAASDYMNCRRLDVPVK